MYLSTIEDPTIFKNLASILHAITLANSVFPVPGGPYNKTPFGGLIPILLNNCGFVKGNSIASLKSLI
jgi:hypothetical protein